MKFSKFKEYRPSIRTSEEVIKYLSVDLKFSLTDLFTGLTRLRFSENFESFQTVVEVAATGDTQIRHSLQEIPTGKIILKDGGSNDIVDGDTAWDKNFVYLKNLGGSPVTVTVVFFR